MTMQHLSRYIQILVVFGLIWGGMFVFNNYGCSRAEGPEMQPAIPHEKSLTLDPNARHPEQLSRDDIIVYMYDIAQKGATRKVTSRVVGLPGDRVKIVKGELFVNNEKVGSADKKAAEDYAEIIVPRNTVFALCDNRSGSKELDSRKIGPIGSWAIVGKLR
ncbi:MAG TPA: signal peptidase I [Planctomycetota bacterium]|jgi:signal peptidase I|nr:signal peptidase I [Planctomycetota bacterium]